jgi:hypothetical protein
MTAIAARPLFRDPVFDGAATWLYRGTARGLRYTSANLLDWGRAEALDLRSGKVIDAAVHSVPGGYRMWFKDEEHGSHTYAPTTRKTTA